MTPVLLKWSVPKTEFKVVVRLLKKQAIKFWVFIKIKRDEELLL